MTATTVATINLKHSMSRAAMQQDLLKVLGKGSPDMIGLQEISRDRAKSLRAFFARNGYGMTIQNGVPIAYKLSRYKMVDTGSRLLHGHANVGPAGAGPNVTTKKFANFAALRDKQTGDLNVLTDVHLLASNRLTPQRRSLYHKEVVALAAMQRDLRKKYGKDAHYFLTGDMNTSKKGSLGAVNDMLNLYRPPNPTQRHGYLDWIGSTLGRGHAETVALRSDHDAYLMTFGKGGTSDTGNGGGNGGGGKGHGGGGNGGKPHDPFQTDAGHGPVGGVHNPGGKGHGGPAGHGFSAFDLFSDLLESWGVPVGADIEDIIRKAVIDGITPDNIGLIVPEIQSTQSWLTRFPGWAKRVSNGYNQVSVDEYLQLENSYHRIMQEAGLPVGFYDDPSDFGNWIANDTSPDEIQSRVQMAVTKANEIDPTARNLMARFYGLSTGDVASYFLDSSRALPVIQRQYEAAGVASWAARNGFDVNGMNRYESLVDSGVTTDQAAKAYGTVKSLADSVGNIAGVYGENYNQTDAENDVFFGQDEKRRKLVTQEAATFSGQSRGATGSAKRQSY